MDLGVDQGSPHSDLARFKDGKYLYRLPNGKLDIDRYNREFNQYTQKRQETEKEAIQRKLNNLNSPPKEIAPYDLSIGQIMINIKNTIFSVMDELLSFTFTWQSLWKDYRLFYLGLFLIMIATLVYLFFFFASGTVIDGKSLPATNIQEIKLYNGQP